MIYSLGTHGVLAVQVALTWASFSPLLPLLTGPRQSSHDDVAPSTLLLRLAWSIVPVVVTSIAASTMRLRLAVTAAKGNTRPGMIARAVARGVAGLVVGSLTVHTVAVILSAPILRKLPETWAFSVLIAALTFVPVWVSNKQPLQAFSTFVRGIRPVMYDAGSMVPAVGCAIGAWLGAIPLCLDWEQPWQVWPLPMTVGGLLGFSLGALFLLATSTAAHVRRRLLPAGWPAKHS